MKSYFKQRIYKGHKQVTVRLTPSDLQRFENQALKADFTDPGWPSRYILWLMDMHEFLESEHPEVMVEMLGYKA